jgi:hypothetical protein
MSCFYFHLKMDDDEFADPIGQELRISRLRTLAPSCWFPN